MTNQHPLTPPPELVQQWQDEWNAFALGARYPSATDTASYVAIRAAQWGADQELEACCEWFAQEGYTPNTPTRLRAARRPKPPSLKEQALDDFNGLMQELDGAGAYSNCADRIRRALEALPE